MLLGTLSAALLGNMLEGKAVIAARAGKGTITAREDTIRVIHGF